MDEIDIEKELANSRLCDCGSGTPALTIYIAFGVPGWSVECPDCYTNTPLNYRSAIEAIQAWNDRKVEGGEE